MEDIFLLGCALDNAVDFGKVLANIISFLRISLGISPVAGSTKRICSHTTRSAGLSAAIGIVLGGLIPLFIIPFLDRYVVKSKHHIAIGDHDDLKKDLKAKHK